MGAKDYISFAKSILSEIKEKPVSIEVFADDENECLKQALIISELGKNVYVKIPITYTNILFFFLEEDDILLEEEDYILPQEIFKPPKSVQSMID